MNSMVRRFIKTQERMDGGTRRGGKEELKVEEK
jgi:hypothetical protein